MSFILHMDIGYTNFNNTYQLRPNKSFGFGTRYYKKVDKDFNTNKAIKLLSTHAEDAPIGLDFCIVQIRDYLSKKISTKNFKNTLTNLYLSTLRLLTDAAIPLENEYNMLVSNVAKQCNLTSNTSKSFNANIERAISNFTGKLETSV